MEKIALSPDVSLSRLVYGVWRLGDDENTSAAHVQAKVEACLAQGITSMDQADIYFGHRPEALFGAALKGSPGLRDQIEIITKCDIVAPVGRHSGATVKYYDTGAAHIQASVEASLRDMGTDRIDVLLLHRPDPLMDAHETGACLDALVASGKVLAAGVSNFRPWDFTLLQSAMKTPLVTNQIEIGLTSNTPFTNGDVAFHQERGQPIMAWSPLAGGSLLSEAQSPLRDALHRMGAEQGVDWSAIAVAWLLRHPGRILPVMGTSSLARIARLSEALKVEMNRPEWFALYTHALGHEVP